MKSRIVLFLILIVATACNNNASHSKHLHFVNVYENALMHGDVNVAVNACYEIIANDSTKTNNDFLHFISEPFGLFSFLE